MSLSGPTPRTGRTGLTALAGTALLTVSLVAGPPAPAAPTAAADRQAQGRQAAAPSSPSDLDVMYVGAHPDDEASRLSVFGEWEERFGARTGVVTVTRGEGGGNAVGTEEGPALGLLREAEERRAVGRAGIADVFNLDKVDFYYSVSAPLHQEAWRARETLGRLVRIIRQTTPEVLVTMNPAPSPGNHGGHQEAALLAVEAYAAAGDPTRFPRQIRREGLEPFAPSKLFTTAVRGTSGAPGPNCATSYTPTSRADDVYGVWSGRRSREYGTTWAQVERAAQREYVSQGWGGFPDVSPDPATLACDFHTQIDARVPFTRGDLTADAAPSSTMLEGAVLRSVGGLPRGTGLDLSTDDFDVVPGGTTRVRVALTAPRRGLDAARAFVDLPAGWRARQDVLRFGDVRPGRTKVRTVRVSAPADAATGVRGLVQVEVRAAQGSGTGTQQLAVVPEVSGTQELLPQVAIYHRWAEANGVEQLKGTVKPVLTLPSGGSRTVDVDVTNHGTSTRSGAVSLELPAGFAVAQASRPYADLAPGETTQVSFEVTNTDAGLPTSNQGGTGGSGDYDYTITTTTGTTTGTGSSQSVAALELVPATAVADTAAPSLDGVVEEGEYAAEVDLSRLWEGTACESPADCGGTGHVTRSGDDLYVAATVVDDVRGTIMTPDDCKRHWRTDSVEIAIDPTGTSENTSTTFKAAIMPETTAGESCAARDADNRQGPIATTAPGVDAVAAVSEPYTGYVVEVRIPMSELPDTVDPQRLAMNLFVYDSDTPDKTGQTRLGWSTWGGVQGDPYRWGRVTLTGEVPPTVPTRAPDLDFPALDSLQSWQSIAQAVRTGVPLSGLPAARNRRSGEVLSALQRGRAVRVSLRARARGTAHVFVVDRRGQVVGELTRTVRPGLQRLRVPTDGAARRVLVGWDPAGAPGTTSSARRVRR